LKGLEPSGAPLQAEPGDRLSMTRVFSIWCAACIPEDTHPVNQEKRVNPAYEYRPAASYTVAQDLQYEV